jgi:hypothetical protein
MISLILCAILALSLFSCADHSEKNPGGTQGSSPEKTTAPEQTTEAQSTVTPIAEAMRIEEGYVYLIADTYSDAEKDMTYHPDSKTPRTNFEIKEVKEKYTVEYIVDLFKK